MLVSDLPVAKIRTIPTTRITYFVTEYQQNAQFYVIVRDRSSWIEAFAPRVIFLRRDLSPQAVWHNYGSPCSLPLSSGEPCDHLLRPEAAILIARRREREARHIDDVSIARGFREIPFPPAPWCGLPMRRFSPLAQVIQLGRRNARRSRQRMTMI